MVKKAPTTKTKHQSCSGDRPRLSPLTTPYFHPNLNPSATSPTAERPTREARRVLIDNVGPPDYVQILSMSRFCPVFVLNMSTFCQNFVPVSNLSRLCPQCPGFVLPKSKVCPKNFQKSILCPHFVSTSNPKSLIYHGDKFWIKFFEKYATWLPWSRTKDGRSLDRAVKFNIDST